MDSLKNIVKGVFKGILRSKIFILIMVILLILVVLLPACVYYITIDDGTYSEDDWSNVPYVASTYTGSAVVSTEGITTEKKNWQEFKEKEDDTSKYSITDVELDKLMNAEIRSQYPRIKDAKTELNGIVEFQRHKEDGTIIKLEFINLDTFQRYINSNNPDVEKFFTLDENKNLLIGVVKETKETVTYNDSNIQISDYSKDLSTDNLIEEGKYEKITYEVKEKVIDYRKLIKKYSLPFQYLWSLIVASDDKEFALELVDLLDDSKIMVSIYESVTTTEEEAVFSYDKQKKVDVTATATCSTNYGDYSKDASWKPADEWTEGNYEVRKVTEIKEKIILTTVSEADVWSMYYKKEYILSSATLTDTEENENDLNDIDYISVAEESSNTNVSNKIQDLLNDLVNDLINDVTSLVEQENANNSVTDSANMLANDVANSVEQENVTNSVAELVIESAEITSYSNEYYERIVNRHQNNKTTIYQQTYMQRSTIGSIKASKKTKEEIKNGTGQDNFVTILCEIEHSEAKYKLTQDVTSWLFELLESNPDTNNMIDLTKYLLYAVTGEDTYGISDYDFSEFDTSGFTDIGGIITGGSIQEKVWNSLKALGYSDISVAGVMGNIHYESGSFNPSAVEGGYTEDTGGIGICQWTNNHRGTTGRNAQLRAFAESRGLSWQDEDVQVEFLIGELTKGGGADGYASYQLADTTELYRSQLACASAWINAKNVEDSTKAFCYSFERPKKEAAESSMSTRISYANQYYAMYAGK